MSKADEMFKELGYEKHTTNDYIGYYQYDENSNTILILFLKNKKAIAIRYDGCNAPAIELKELQAINKKCQELRWIK